jgi:hypothetical protein
MAQYDVGQSAAGRIRRGQPGEYVFAGRLAARPPSQASSLISDHPTGIALCGNNYNVCKKSKCVSALSSSTP